MDPAGNDAHLNVFPEKKAAIVSAVGRTVVFQEGWGPLTRRRFATVEFDGTRPIDEVSGEAAAVMTKMVAATLPLLLEHGLHAALS